jgi:hypothetical protein
MRKRFNLYLRWIGIPVVVYLLFGFVSLSLYGLGGCQGAIGSGIKCMKDGYGNLFAYFEVSMIIVPFIYLAYFAIFTVIFGTSLIVNPLPTVKSNDSRLSLFQKLFLGLLAFLLLRLTYSFLPGLAAVTNFDFFCKTAKWPGMCYGKVAARKKSVLICLKADANGASCLQYFGNMAQTADDCAQLKFPEVAALSTPGRLSSFHSSCLYKFSDEAIRRRGNR